MLYKNKIKVQNILKSAVALMLMLTLSLSTALSPLAKAEEARWTWKTLTTVPAHRIAKIYISPDGSKLFGLESDNAPAHNTSLWMSADDGATWRKIFSKQTMIGNDIQKISADGSKIVLEYEHSFSISTDGGQSWVERGPDPGHAIVLISPDGSFLVSCSGIGTTVFTTHISTDDGQNWTQKGTNSIGCPSYVANNGTLIARNGNVMARSTDYGQTWTETSNLLGAGYSAEFSNNGNNIFDGNRISLDGGNHWTPSNASIPAGHTIMQTGISDDGKKLFVTTAVLGGASPHQTTLLTSVDGGRTWHSELGYNDGDMMAMSSDGSKMFYMYDTVYRVGTLPAAQPVTPGAGAGGTATPSASASATSGQKPGKASGRLAETGISVQLIGGLAVVAIVSGLVLRKRL